MSNTQTIHLNSLAVVFLVYWYKKTALFEWKTHHLFIDFVKLSYYRLMWTSKISVPFTFISMLRISCVRFIRHLMTKYRIWILIQNKQVSWVEPLGGVVGWLNYVFSVRECWYSWKRPHLIAGSGLSSWWNDSHLFELELTYRNWYNIYPVCSSKLCLLQNAWIL